MSFVSKHKSASVRAEETRALIAQQAEAIATRVKPRLRGVFHQYAFFVALVAGLVLILAAPNGHARLAVVIYAISVIGLFGTSALYHRVNWSQVARRWMRRLDHSMIFCLIAGTYTPIALLALTGGLAKVLLVIVWSGAALGIVLKLFWIDAPKLLSAAIYLALGWVMVISFPDLFKTIGLLGALLLGAGGALYTTGAVIYALRRPDPVPAIFGYHEIFHILVIVAAALQFSVIALIVLPQAK